MSKVKSKIALNTFKDSKVNDLADEIIKFATSSKMKNKFKEASDKDDKINEYRKLIHNYSDEIYNLFKNEDLGFSWSFRKKLLQGQNIEGSSKWTSQNQDHSLDYLKEFLDNIEETNELKNLEEKIEKRKENTKNSSQKRLSLTTKEVAKKDILTSGYKDWVKHYGGFENGIDKIIESVENSLNRIHKGKKLTEEDIENIKRLGKIKNQEENDFDLDQMNDTEKEKQLELINPKSIEKNLSERLVEKNISLDNSLKLAEFLVLNYNEVFLGYLLKILGGKIVTADKRKSSREMAMDIAKRLSSKEGLSYKETITSENTNFTPKTYETSINYILDKLDGELNLYISDYYKSLENKESSKRPKGIADDADDLKKLIELFKENPSEFLGKRSSNQRNDAILLFKTLKRIYNSSGLQTKEEKATTERQKEKIQQARLSAGKNRRSSYKIQKDTFPLNELIEQDMCSEKFRKNNEKTLNRLRNSNKLPDTELSCRKLKMDQFKRQSKDLKFFIKKVCGDMEGITDKDKFMEQLDKLIGKDLSEMKDKEICNQLKNYAILIYLMDTAEMMGIDSRIISKIYTNEEISSKENKQVSKVIKEITGLEVENPEKFLKTAFNEIKEGNSSKLDSILKTIVGGKLSKKTKESEEESEEEISKKSSKLKKGMIEPNESEEEY